MKHVWLLIDKVTNNVIAIYDNEDIAAKMLPYIEKQVNSSLFVDRRSINQELSMIGVVR